MLSASKMPRRQLAGLILASALVTLDGTATTIALPAIGAAWSTPMFRLQWIGNAPLLVLAALLLPAGSLADRFGRVRVIRAGLVTFVAGALVAAAAPSDLVLIAARLAQGAGGALILPAVLAVLRGGHPDAAERTRVFGVWAAWTGAAGARALGPLLGGSLVDLLGWRAVFLPAAAAALASALLLEREMAGGGATRRLPIPLTATSALIVLFGATAYLLMAGASEGMEVWLAMPGGLALTATVVFARSPQRHLLLPRELLRARNCLPANVSTFALDLRHVRAVVPGLALHPAGARLFAGAVRSGAAAHLGHARARRAVRPAGDSRRRAGAHQQRRAVGRRRHLLGGGRAASAAAVVASDRRHRSLRRRH